MLAPEPVNRSRYVLLATLFLAAFGFQLSIWVQDFSDLWAQRDPLATLFTASWVLVVILHVFTPATALVLGFYVTWVRVEDRRAWLMLAVLITFSINANGSDVHDRIMGWTTPLKHVALAYRTAGLRSWPIWMLVFAIYFPERAAFDVRRPALKWIFLLPLLVAYLLGITLRVAGNEGGTMAASFQSLDQIGSLANLFLYRFGIPAFLLILLAKALYAKNADAKRRLGVLFTGLAVSLLPAAIADAILHNMMHVREEAMLGWVEVAVYSTLALFPVTLAYVTVVQRALNVRVLVRQSLQYALARRGLIFLQVAISLLVIAGVALFSGRATFGARLLITAVGVGSVLGVGLGARRLAAWIDRRFFRDAYHATQVLTRLADSVRSIVELEPLLKTVVGKISEALHVSEMAVFLRQNDLYQPAFAIGSSHSFPASFAEHTEFLQALRSQQKPLPVYLDDQRSWLTKLDTTATANLHQLRTQLLLPLARGGDLLGFLSLGPKASEAPYSSTDLELLQSVAFQTTLAVENSQLIATIAANTAERQVIASELAIARGVQERLLPQVLPRIAGVEYAATSRPAHEVGGDYYDFLELREGGLGIAIGDVSGKGIPAALLMASLQATLRGQTVSGPFDIAQLLCNLNRAIYALSSAYRYATFFYCHYQPNLQRLTYSNAGHNAPVLLRRSGASCNIVRLEEGGPPVGLLPACEYQSAQMAVEPGDLLILYTDGISEAMNLAEQEWGEHNLIALSQRMSDAAPAILINKIFEAADEFSGAAPQHDDMTLIALRFGG